MMSNDILYFQTVLNLCPLSYVIMFVNIVVGLRVIKAVNYSIQFFLINDYWYLLFTLSLWSLKVTRQCPGLKYLTRTNKKTNKQQTWRCKYETRLFFLRSLKTPLFCYNIYIFTDLSISLLSSAIVDSLVPNSDSNLNHLEIFEITIQSI